MYYNTPNPGLIVLILNIYIYIYIYIYLYIYIYIYIYIYLYIYIYIYIYIYLYIYLLTINQISIYRNASHIKIDILLLSINVLLITEYVYLNKGNNT